MEIQLCVSPESDGELKTTSQSSFYSWTSKLENLFLNRDNLATTWPTPSHCERVNRWEGQRSPSGTRKYTMQTFFFLYTKFQGKKKSTSCSFYFLLPLGDLWPSYPLTLSIVNPYKNKSTQSACDNLHIFEDIYYVPLKHFFCPDEAASVFYIPLFFIFSSSRPPLSGGEWIHVYI